LTPFSATPRYRHRAIYHSLHPFAPLSAKEKRHRHLQLNL
ncbi:hypothetical protein LTSEMIN_1617, partial [Salmonella enterica subsp. enterica serovar Minnesota str. A4-603]